MDLFSPVRNEFADSNLPMDFYESVGVAVDILLVYIFLTRAIGLPLNPFALDENQEVGQGERDQPVRTAHISSSQTTLHENRPSRPVSRAHSTNTSQTQYHSAFSTTPRRSLDSTAAAARRVSLDNTARSHPAESSAQAKSREKATQIESNQISERKSQEENSDLESSEESSGREDQSVFTEDMYGN